VVITGLYPDGTATGRVGIIAADVDPATVDPFVMALDPDRSAIWAVPLVVDDRGRGWWWRSDANTDADLRRGVAGANGEEGKRRAAEGGGA
jgi:hypothetical protein